MLLFYLIEPGTQGAEFLRAVSLFFGIEEQHGLGVRRPVMLRTACQQGVERERHGERRQRGGGRDRRAFHPLHRGPLGEWAVRWMRGWNLTSRGSRALFFGSLQCFVNSAHSFLSLGRSGSELRRRSARVANVCKTSSTSNFSMGLACAGAVMAAEALLSPRSKSRATAFTTLGETVFCWSTNALTRQCSQIRFTTRGIPLA